MNDYPRLPSRFTYSSALEQVLRIRSLGYPSVNNYDLDTHIQELYRRGHNSNIAQGSIYLFSIPLEETDAALIASVKARVRSLYKRIIDSYNLDINGDLWNHKGTSFLIMYAVPPSNFGCGDAPPGNGVGDHLVSQHHADGDSLEASTSDPDSELSELI